MTTKINYEKCTGCRACYRECPTDCIGWDEEENRPFMAYPDECWHCGICEYECHVEAIDVSLPLRAYAREVDKRFLG